MRLKDIHHYDTYVPILAGLQRKHTWDQAVNLVLKSLEPLGSDYCGALEKGLRGRWCDRYENRGKQSGAFSSGTFDGDPYILMNYQPDVLDHVFTLAHEAGHSMHSWHSARRQPFAYYNYVIFVAEVASTFNEQLLSRYLLDNARNDEERAFLVNRQLDAMRSTIFRQTMFAEFEKLAHQSSEAGEPLTLERFKEIYHGLLQQYFGPDFVIDDELSSRVPADPALLPGVLRLQVRHRHVGRDLAGRSRDRRRPAGTQRLLELPQGRLFERPARPAPRRRRRHAAARRRRSGHRALWKTRGGTRFFALRTG